VPSARHDPFNGYQAVPGVHLRPDGLAWHDPFHFRDMLGLVSEGTSPAGLKAAHHDPLAWYSQGSTRDREASLRARNHHAQTSHNSASQSQKAAYKQRAIKTHGALVECRDIPSAGIEARASIGTATPPVQCPPPPPHIQIPHR
jgi:hypothetical protein